VINGTGKLATLMWPLGTGLVASVAIGVRVAYLAYVRYAYGNIKCVWEKGDVVNEALCPN
jgi:hypothetical protein